jgi:hypothetical protein
MALYDVQVYSIDLMTYVAIDLCVRVPVFLGVWNCSENCDLFPGRYGFII